MPLCGSMLIAVTSSQVYPDRFGLCMSQQRLEALVAALTRLLVATPWLRHVAMIPAVDPHHAGFEPSGQAVGVVEVARPDAGGQAIDGVVGQRHRLVDGLEL